ncbi:MAG: hypothetical protein HQM10_23350 [Candidatus Riflebacteria bacterium]|nr:hypothetical protein [Candidatus Riflebacteria bacterium]
MILSTFSRAFLFCVGLFYFCVVASASAASASPREEARMLFAAGKKSEAAVVLEQAIAIKPSPDLFIELASMLGKTGDYSRALSVAQKGCDAFPGKPGLENLRGLILFRSGDPEAAKNCWKNLLAMHPGDAFATEWLAKLEKAPSNDTSEGRGSQAAAVSESNSVDADDVVLSKTDQEKLAARLFAGIRASDKNDLDGIEAMYRKLIAKCPDTEAARESCWRLSNLYIYARNPSDFRSAMEVLETFMKRYAGSPAEPLIINELIAVYDMLGEYAKLAELYRPVFADESKVKDEFYFIHGIRYANALEKLGQKDAAKVILENVKRKAEGVNQLAASLAASRLGKN